MMLFVADASLRDIYEVAPCRTVYLQSGITETQNLFPTPSCFTGA